MCSTSEVFHSLPPATVGDRDCLPWIKGLGAEEAEGGEEEDGKPRQEILLHSVLCTMYRSPVPCLAQRNCTAPLEIGCGKNQERIGNS